MKDHFFLCNRGGLIKGGLLYSNVSNLKRKSSSSTVVDYKVTACALLRKIEIVCMNRERGTSGLS
jgi:hypothetical protein